MLEGTDLFSAYQPLNQNSSLLDNFNDDSVRDNSPKIEQKQEIPQQQPIKRIDNDQVQSVSTNNMYDASSFNKQYEQEQKILYAVNELKKRKEQYVQQTSNNNSYIEKLFSKKKEIVRLFQFALIIVLGLSIHFIIKHYLKIYIADHDFSQERQLFIRVLYPVAILFVLWNLKVFVK